MNAVIQLHQAANDEPGHDGGDTGVTTPPFILGCALLIAAQGRIPPAKLTFFLRQFLPSVGAKPGEMATMEDVLAQIEPVVADLERQLAGDAPSYSITITANPSPAAG